MYELILFSSFVLILIITFFLQHSLIKSRYKYGWIKVFIPSVTFIVVQQYFFLEADSVGWERALGYFVCTFAFGTMSVVSTLHGLWLRFRKKEI
jgi:hypothetical protein